jgi:GrpB-like predicted nucleotidyltransferase (UPF0157 family)
MNGLPEFSKGYFERFSTEPVTIKPFDPQSRVVARKYKDRLERLLEPYGLKAAHRGSTYFGICGKGEVELGIYPKNEDWYRVVVAMINYYKAIGNLDNEYARFNDSLNGFEIEVILMTGHSAIVDRKLNEYLNTRPNLLKEYETVKSKYAFSKREYMTEKDKFLRKVIAEIPE